MNEVKELKKRLSQAEVIIKRLCNWYNALSNVNWMKPLYHKPTQFEKAEQFLNGNIENKEYHLKEQLNYLDSEYSFENPSSGQTASSNIEIKAKKTYNLFISIIWHCIENNLELKDDEKSFVHRYFALMCDEFKESLEKPLDAHKKIPKYSAEQAFNVIRTLNCSLEDKLKIADLFEYMEN